MNKTVIEKKLPKITLKIIKEFQPEKIILFGSFAWGEPTPESDIDLLIIKKSQKDRIERGQEIERILWGADMPIDALVYTPDEVKKRLELEDFFIQDIFKKGKILYSKS